MLRFTASCLIALSIGLMIGATVAATLPAEEPTVSQFQGLAPPTHSATAGNFTGLTEPGPFTM